MGTLNDGTGGHTNHIDDRSPDERRGHAEVSRAIAREQVSKGKVRVVDYFAPFEPPAHLRARPKSSRK